MEGRETGKPGQQKAAVYIAEHFENVGLKPVNGSYMQEVPLTVSQFKGGLFSIGEGQYVYKNDWVPYPGIEVSDVEGPAIFVGYGIQDEGWDDYAGLDVQGKVVIMLAGEPGNEKRLHADRNQGAQRLEFHAQCQTRDCRQFGRLGSHRGHGGIRHLEVAFLALADPERMRLDVDREGRERTFRPC